MLILLDINSLYRYRCLKGSSLTFIHAMHNVFQGGSSVCCCRQILHKIYANLSLSAHFYLFLYINSIWKVSFPLSCWKSPIFLFPLPQIYLYLPLLNFLKFGFPLLKGRYTVGKLEKSIILFLQNFLKGRLKNSKNAKRGIRF